MTTAHRPTFDPARGKDVQKGPAYHQRLLPAHTQLKLRQPGQGGSADPAARDLRAQLLQAEAAHFSKVRGSPSGIDGLESERASSTSRRVENSTADDGDVVEEPDAKRRRVLEETRQIDADSEDSGNDSSEEESDEEDETAELMRELEKIKRERAEQREKEATFYMRRKMTSTDDFNVRRRWDDDVVFKNQARGTEDKKKKEFVNDLLRSDFHKRFMSKYVR
ncbi:MAG: complexed with cef1p [Icmadophila ericetorum]|nr:complexed with cef1p [Icmadophila ericetorum]